MFFLGRSYAEGLRAWAEVKLFRALVNEKCQVLRKHLALLIWSGRGDLDPGPQRPERCALTGLRYAPTGVFNYTCFAHFGKLGDA